MKRPISSLVAWLLVSGSLVACGGTGPAATPPPTNPTSHTSGPALSVDSCALLSDDEIRGATGLGVSSRRASTLTQVFPSVCDIELDGTASLTVGIKTSGGRTLYEQSFEPFIGEGDFAPLDEAVPGLGDKAGRSGDDSLMVLSGDVLFDLHYLEFGRPNKLVVLRYLAEVILAKLPCIAAGCPGFSPPPPPAQKAIDVCALLTSSEVESTTGHPVLNMEAKGTLAVPACRWTLDTDPGGPFVGLHYVELRVTPTGGRAEFDYWANEAYEDDLESIPGLGDDAVKTADIPSGLIYVVKGDRLFTLKLSMPLSVSDPYELVVPLIEFALERL